MAGEVKKNTKTDKRKEKLMEVAAQTKYLRISPRKLRLVAEAVKRLSPAEALEYLELWNRKGSRLLKKAIKTALSDAQNNFSLEKESIHFKEIVVTQGPRLKRVDRFHGARFNQGLRQKRMSHVRIILIGREGQ
ncbi:MAG: uL22 family ribosomal protein [Candidatus Shapirobacteria bacterium]